jgi:hypothetical protein
MLPIIPILVGAVGGWVLCEAAREDTEKNVGTGDVKNDYFVRVYIPDSEEGDNSHNFIPASYQEAKDLYAKYLKKKKISIGEFNEKTDYEKGERSPYSNRLYEYELKISSISWGFGDNVFEEKNFEEPKQPEIPEATTAENIPAEETEKQETPPEEEKKGEEKEEKETENK